jgi:DNA-binding MarR family transcriptional regulator
MIDKVSFSKITHEWMDIFMHRSWRSWNHLAKSTGLSMPQFGILMQVHHRGNCAIGDVSEHFDITSAAASQLVDKLVQNGLIHRDEDPNDRRAKMLNLTDKGQELIQLGVEERFRWVEQLSEKLTPEERKKVTEALILMTRAARELDSEPVQQSG